MHSKAAICTQTRTPHTPTEPHHAAKLVPRTRCTLTRHLSRACRHQRNRGSPTRHTVSFRFTRNLDAPRTPPQAIQDVYDTECCSCFYDKSKAQKQQAKWVLNVSRMTCAQPCVRDDHCALARNQKAIPHAALSSRASLLAPTEGPVLRTTIEECTQWPPAPSAAPLDCCPRSRSPQARRPLPDRPALHAGPARQQLRTPLHHQHQALQGAVGGAAAAAAHHGPRQPHCHR